MSVKIVFASNNINKLYEIKQKLSNNENFEILTLDDIGFSGEIPELGSTIEENAVQKAQYIYDRYRVNCFSDDTGLEIDSLEGNPGVKTARYAGEYASSSENLKKVLSEMKGIENRKARFKTVIALILDGKRHIFEGIVEGDITKLEYGEKGFGYDPIFCPDGYKETFSQMSLEQKNTISHRSKAVEKLVNFLNNNNKN